MSTHLENFIASLPEEEQQAIYVEYTRIVNTELAAWLREQEALPIRQLPRLARLFRERSVFEKR